MSVTVKQIVDSQVHIGTLKSEAHPKTSNYRLDIVNNIVVLNPEMILEQLNKAKKKVQDVKKSGQEVLVVCEKKMYATEMKTLGERYGVSYLNYKAPGGFLTNFDTFKTRISSMNKMSAFVETEEFASLTKKEQLVYKRKLSRTKKIYEGVKNLTTKPGLVIVVDGSMMRNFVRELPAQGAVDSIVISSTNYDQYLGDNDIIANMLSYKSIDFVMNYILS
ncbi:MAG TPA: 30S ribosomal protein S2 [Candidatus Absconditabacterales bacterium]|nr:30S ribosomal protein S2 [Candidatus Absconditabacterales bacterium]HOQ78909.1 30S ribosomal protein S2 [Candidatus Absconditabacterales bacterium]HPK27948.1 30S ribosomal protein S2 [Candidatus Absconditabacterales bacterium]